MPGPTLRQADRNDAEAIIAIEQRCFSSDRISPRQIKYLLGRDTALSLVALVDGSVAGCCIGLLPKRPRPGRVYSLAVLPEYRSQNVARRLMVRLLAEMKQRGYSRCRLEVRHSACAVRAFYERLGFQNIARLQGYYQDGEDGVRMELSLAIRGDTGAGPLKGASW